MFHFHCTHGVGDTYLVCALWRAFENANGPATISVQPQHEHVAQMFDARFQVMHRPMVTAGEHAWRSGIAINAHPSHAARGDAIDALTGREGFSQADMYRFILRLPWDAPLSKPVIRAEWKRQAKEWAAARRVEAGKAVVIMPFARSMPAAPIEFWMRLATMLVSRGKQVVFNAQQIPRNVDHETAEPFNSALATGRIVQAYPTLGILYGLIEHCGWVIGPNTGGFVGAVAAELEAMKTLVAFHPTPGEPFRFNAGIVLDHPFPFSHQRKFCGRDLEVDEYTVTPSPGVWREVGAQIAESKYARGVAQLPGHGPKRILRAPVSVGDMIDRMTILEIKIARGRLPPHERMVVTRELREIRDVLSMERIDLAAPAMGAHVAALRRANEEGFKIGGELYAMLAAGKADDATTDDAKHDQNSVDMHYAMMRTNRDRVRARQAIDAAAGSLFGEVKTYNLG